MKGLRTSATPWLRPLAVGLVAALAAMACSSNDDDDTADQTTAPTESAAPVETLCPEEAARSAILRYATRLDDLQRPGLVISMDPTLSTDQARIHMVWGLLYDNLVRRVGGSDEYTPGLATSWEIVDPRTITFELREGVTFHDGTPFNAEAVKFGLERSRDTNNGASRSPLLGNLEDVEVTGELSVTIHLNADVAGGFLDILTSGEGSIVSPTAAQDPSINMDTQGVGAGPYEVVSVDNQVISLRQVEGYWDEDNWCLAGIDFVNTPLGPPRVNAWQAGTADMTEFPLSDLGGDRSVAGDSTVERTTLTGSLELCSSSAPFDDPLVRKALGYAVDRDAINEANFQGNSQVTWGLYPEDNIYYDPELAEVYSYDPDRARALLTEAGHPDGVSVKLVFFPVPSSQRTAEIIQATAAEAGFDIELVQSSPDIISDFYKDGRLGPLLVSGMPWSNLNRIVQSLAPDYQGNACNFKDPKLQEMQAGLRPLDPTSPEAIELAQEAARYIIDDLAIKVMLVDDPMIWAVTDKVHNLVNSGSQNVHPDFRGVYMTS